MLSRLLAVRRPSSWARSRTSAFVISPIGRRVRAISSGPSMYKHVRLVLRGIDTACDRAPVGGIDDARVVTGRDLVEAELLGPLDHAPELHRAVALDAWVGRLARAYDLDVRRDNARRRIRR